MNRHCYYVPRVICRVALSLLIGACLLGVGTARAGVGTVKFHQTRYLYTDLPRSIACRLCTGLAQGPMQDINNFVYCTSCLKTVRNITTSGRLSTGRDVSALKEAFPHSPQAILSLVGSLGQELETLEQTTAQQGDGRAGSLAKERSFFTSAAESIQTKIDDFDLECQDCQKTVSYKDAVRHAETHVVACSCHGYSPAGVDGEYLYFADRVKKLKQHVLEANPWCRYCGQDVGHINITRHEAYCPEKEIVCPVCQDTMPIGRLSVHVTRGALRDHSSVACPLCVNRRHIHGLGFAKHMATHHSPRPWVQGECPFCPINRWTMSDTDLIAHVALNHPEEYVRLSTCADKDSLPSATEKILHQLITTWVAPPVSQDSRQIVGEIMQSSPCALARDELPAPECDLETLASSVDKLSLQQRIAAFTCHDGCIVWRIPGYSGQKKRGGSGQVRSIYSPPFYLGRRGYKLCLQAYLNGNGLGEGTHLSLFLVLMKGEFDPLLEFPLDARATMRVFNQHDPGKNVEASFRSDVTSSYWDRPVTSENKGAGIPLIISQEKLENDNAGYIASDTLYLGCRVTLRSTSQTEDWALERHPEDYTGESSCVIQ